MEPHRLFVLIQFILFAVYVTSSISVCCVLTQSNQLTDVTNDITVSQNSLSPRDLPIPPSICVQPSSPCHELLFDTPLRFSQPHFHRRPLPCFQWADGGDVWRVMREKETKATFRRDPDMFERHAGLDARMRSVLLDWLIEVITL